MAADSPGRLGRLTPGDERAIRALAVDLQVAWRAATIKPGERARIARLLIDHVGVTIDKVSERFDVAAHWVGGLVESQTVLSPARRHDLQPDYAILAGRLWAPRAAQHIVDL